MKGSRRFLPPALILITAFALLALRATVADWRGLTVARDSLPRPSRDGSLAASARSGDKPSRIASVDPEPAGNKAGAVWEDIGREAARKRAEIAELDRLKAQADEKARNQPPRPEEIVAARNRQVMERILQAHQELARQQMDRVLDVQREMQRRHFERIDQMLRAFGRLPGEPAAAPPEAAAAADTVRRLREAHPGLRRSGARVLILPNGQGVTMMRWGVWTNEGQPSPPADAPGD